MRFANIDHRAHVETSAGRYVDIETASGGLFPADPHECLNRWEDLCHWAGDASWRPHQERTYPREALSAPVPRPTQVLAVGLNYAQHADETGLAAATDLPLTFTKFPTSVAAPYGELSLPSHSVDWEVELVAVIGKFTYRIDEQAAWNHVAGLTLGQDYSDRDLQMMGNPPQFSLAKSYRGFAPIGPVMVTVDELVDPNAVTIECLVNGQLVQCGNSKNLLHSIPRLVAHFSSVCPLLPGDLIFTGTPEGVGMGQDPPIYLRDGDEVVSRADGIGELIQRCVPLVPRETASNA